MNRFVGLLGIFYNNRGEREFLLCSDVLIYKAISHVSGSLSC